MDNCLFKGSEINRETYISWLVVEVAVIKHLPIVLDTLLPTAIETTF